MKCLMKMQNRTKYLRNLKNLWEMQLMDLM